MASPRHQLLAGLLAASTFAAACSGSDDSSAEAGDTGDGTVALEASFGSITVAADPSVGDLTISEVSTSEVDEVLAAVELGPDGAEFDEPAMVSVTLPLDALPDDVDPHEELAAATLSETHGDEVVEDLEVTVSDGQVTIVAELDHFSGFGIMLTPRRYDLDSASVEPPFYTMAVGETWEPPVHLDSSRGSREIGQRSWFEFQAITTTGSIVTVADTQVRCDELGEGELTVHGVVRLKSYQVKGSNIGMAELFRMSTTGATFDIVEQNVDAGATVDCEGFIEGATEDEPAGTDPRSIPKNDQQCLDPSGAETTGCGEIEFGFVGYDRLLLGLPGETGPWDTASVNFLTEDGMFGISCDGLDLDTFDFFAPGTTNPCRFNFFEGGLGAQLDIDAPLPDMTLTNDGIEVGLWGDWFTIDPAGQLALGIPEDTFTVDGDPVPSGVFTLDDVSGTMRPEGGNYTVATFPTSEIVDALD